MPLNGSMDFGEQVLGAHPWVRCIDDRIVRYVHPTAEDPAIAALRQSGTAGDLILPRALNRLKDNLETELEALSAAGVPVVKSTVKVCPIPVFDKTGQVVDSHLGLEINSDYIFGIPIEYYRPETEEERHKVIEEINLTFNGLESYMIDRTHSQTAPLSDIYGAHQYMYGSPEVGGEPKVTLIDTDPYYMKPTPANFLMALDSLANSRAYLIRTMNNS